MENKFFLIIAIVIVFLLIVRAATRIRIEAKLKNKITFMANMLPRGGTLFVGNDSIGCSVRAQSFGSIIGQFFEKYINFSSPVILNKTNSFNSILKHNLNVEEIKLLQQLTTRHVKKGMGLLKVLLDLENLQDDYAFGCNDKDTKITTSLKCELAPYVVITTGSNDLMHVLNADPLSIIFDRQKRKEAIKKIKKTGVKCIALHATRGVNLAIENIKAVNHDSKIIVLGLYVPNYLRFFEKLFCNTYISDIVSHYNEELENICKQHGVKYVDISAVKSHTALFDFHPNFIGQLIIANSVLAAISNYNLKSTNIDTGYVPQTIDNLGLAGMLEDAQNRLAFTGFRMDYTARNKRDKLKEYTSEVDIIKEAIKIYNS